ncbi:class E sortase [Candidatus Daviesbacteria bacterium]|nr:class E sortase [Candidatus Daviesbacteria bacterium]
MITVLRRSPGKLLALGFLSIGTIILMQVVLPVVSFQVWQLQQSYQSQVLVSPKRTNERVLGISVQNRDNFPAFVSLNSRETQPNYTKFSVSIPRFKIEKSEVLVDSNDLSQGLVHLPGSALPGEKGNVFISGHSALSSLFALKSAPFAKLPDLKKGDQIIIEASGSKFVYEVSGFKVVDPSNLSVLVAPDDRGRYVSLMTCVPPGLNFKRLVVLGKMI